MQAKHARFVDQLMEAWNSRDPTQAATLYAPQFEGSDISQVAPLHGPADMQDYFDRFFTAFPDARLTVDSVVAEGDQVAISWTAYGTHLGKLMNIPPSGKPVCVQGMSMLAIADGKVIGSRTVWDMAGLLRAIGLLPRLSR